MFQLSETLCKVRSVNGRVEKHGDEDVLAVDVGLTATIANVDLAMFAETLAGAMYLPPDAAQAVVEGVPAISTKLRCPIVKRFPLDYALEGRNVGIDSASGLVRLDMPTSSCDKFVAEPMQGGSVAVDFRVQCSGVSSELIGDLYGMLRHDVKVTLVPSAPVEKGAQEAAGATNGAAGDGKGAETPIEALARGEAAAQARENAGGGDKFAGTIGGEG